MQPVVEYDEPDAKGLQGCPRHPLVPRFDAARVGCSACLSEPEATRPVTLGPGEIAVREAERRGLPDAMKVEDRFWTAWAFMQRRAEMCARKADELYETGATHDLDRAIRLEAVAAKWADSSTKAGKIASVAVFERTRLEAIDRRERLLEAKRQREQSAPASHQPEIH